jgi:hypothetical protein
LEAIGLIFPTPVSGAAGAKLKPLGAGLHKRDPVLSIYTVGDVILLGKLVRDAGIHSHRVYIDCASILAKVVCSVAELVDVGGNDFSSGALGLVGSG